MAYLEDKNYHYITDTEKELEELVRIAKQEKYYSLAEEEFNTLENVLKSKKKKDLILFKTEIEDILVNEIVSRYYFQRGRIESSLASDIAVGEAKRVLKNASEYQAILKPV